MPNLANICLRKPTIEKFYPFTEWQGFGGKKCVNMWLVEHPLFLQGELLWTRFLFGIQQTGAKHLSELMLSVSCFLYVSSNANWPVHEMGARLGIWQTSTASNKTRSFENMVMSYFQSVRPRCKVEASTRRVQIQNWCIQCWWFCGRWSTVFEFMGFCYHYCPFQDARSPIEENIQRGIRKRELDELRKQCIQEKS